MTYNQVRNILTSSYTSVEAAYEAFCSVPEQVWWETGEPELCALPSGEIVISTPTCLPVFEGAI